MYFIKEATCCSFATPTILLLVLKRNSVLTKDHLLQQCKEEHSDNMGTMSIPSRTFCPSSRVANGDIWFLKERDRSKESCLATALKVSCASFVMIICVAKIEWHRCNISWDILDSVFYHSTCKLCDVIFAFLQYKMSITSKQNKDSRKENAILLYFEKPFKLAGIILHFIGT